MSDDLNVAAVEGAPPAPSPLPDAASTDAKKFASLDAVIPEDFEDEDYRGKPVAEILRVAKQHKNEAKQGYESNKKLSDLESELKTTRGILDFIQKRQNQAPQQRPSREQQLQHLQAAPDQFIETQVAPLNSKVAELEGRLYRADAERVRERAGRLSGISSEVWEEIRGPLASIIQAREADPLSEKSWTEAADIYKKNAAKLFAKVEVPSPAPPPAGQAKSTATQKVSGPKFASKRDEENAKALAQQFGFKPNTKAYNELMEELAGDNE